MAVILHERWESPVLNTSQKPFGNSFEVSFIIESTTDDAVATDNDFQAAVAPTFNGVDLSETTVERVSDALNLGGPAKFLFDGVATYSEEDSRETSTTGDDEKGSTDSDRFDTNNSVLQFNTGGGMSNLKNALSEVRFPASAPNRQGAINDTSEGPQGVDIVIPQFNFNITHFEPVANVTFAFINNLFLLTGQVNSSLFQGFAADEVLFLGASGTQRGTADWEINYRFAASPNKVGISIGPISGINKKGWEFLWVEHEFIEDAGRTISNAVNVYVNQVYFRANLNLLSV